MLAENKIPTEELLIELNAYTPKEEERHFYYSPCQQCEKIHIFSRFESVDLEIMEEHNRYSIRKFKAKGYSSFILGCVHLPSKLFGISSRQLSILSLLKKDLKKSEQLAKTDKVMLIGDFNANPFEEAMTSCLGLNATRSQKIAKSLSRQI